MKKSRWYFLMLLFAMLPTAIFSQTVERPAPGFMLSIEDDKTLPDGYPPGYHRLLVTLTNTTDMPERDRILDPHRWNMIVLKDGAPAEETQLMREEKKSREALASGKAVGRPELPGWVKPRAVVKVPCYISDYFDTSKSGTYTITLNEETFPWEPAKSVTVWSNTITIVVPAADKPQPEK